MMIAAISFCSCDVKTDPEAEGVSGVPETSELQSPGFERVSFEIRKRLMGLNLPLPSDGDWHQFDVDKSYQIISRKRGSGTEINLQWTGLFLETGDLSGLIRDSLGVDVENLTKNSSISKEKNEFQVLYAVGQIEGLNLDIRDFKKSDEGRFVIGNIHAYGKAWTVELTGDLDQKHKVLFNRAFFPSEFETTLRSLEQGDKIGGRAAIAHVIQFDPPKIILDISNDEWGSLVDSDDQATIFTIDFEAENQ